jgi:hypothetical protein
MLTCLCRACCKRPRVFPQASLHNAPSDSKPVGGGSLAPSEARETNEKPADDRRSSVGVPRVQLAEHELPDPDTTAAASDASTASGPTESSIPAAEPAPAPASTIPSPSSSASSFGSTRGTASGQAQAGVVRDQRLSDTPAPREAGTPVFHLAQLTPGTHATHADISSDTSGGSSGEQSEAFKEYKLPQLDSDASGSTVKSTGGEARVTPSEGASQSRSRSSEHSGMATTTLNQPTAGP